MNLKTINDKIALAYDDIQVARQEMKESKEAYDDAASYLVEAQDELAALLQLRNQARGK